METGPDRPIRVALLDLNDGQPNRGIPSLRALITTSDRRVQHDVFDVRQKAEVPDLSYDVYISSGGPGSPFEGEGTPWEARYFAWLDALWAHNIRAVARRKHVLFICHSFQMMCRFFELADVTERHTESFGVVSVFPTEAGQSDPLFEGLADPFFAADFRRWQVVQPRDHQLRALGATILAREQPHDEGCERALMGIRLSPEMVGVQFHPEANPAGMLTHFRQPARRAAIVDKFGEARYERLIRRLNTPNYLVPTHDAVVPTFLRRAIRAVRVEHAGSSRRVS